MGKRKKPGTIFRNLSYLNRKYKNGFNEESIFEVANTRLGWYKSCNMNAVNYILSSTLLTTKIKEGAALLNPQFVHQKNSNYRCVEEICSCVCRETYGDRTIFLYLNLLY